MGTEKGMDEEELASTPAISIEGRLRGAASRSQRSGNANEKSAKAQDWVVKAQMG